MKLSVERALHSVSIIIAVQIWFVWLVFAKSIEMLGVYEFLPNLNLFKLIGQQYITHLWKCYIFVCWFQWEKFECGKTLFVFYQRAHCFQSFIMGHLPADSSTYQHTLFRQRSIGFLCQLTSIVCMPNYQMLNEIIFRMNGTNDYFRCLK